MTQSEWLVLKAKLHEAVPGFAQKIAPVYQVLSWEWSDRGTDRRYIPTVADLVVTLYELIDELPEPKGPDGSKHGTGGLEVWVEDGVGGLSFVCDDDEVVA